MASYRFHQVDVFAPAPLTGNPLAVVIGADALTDAQMAAFANWTNLSETSFLLRPTQPDADYRVRIFTPSAELPFAGHPTLGAGHVWLEEGGASQAEHLVQECAAGLIRIRQFGGGETGTLAFAAPKLRRAGPVEANTLAAIAGALRIPQAAIVAANWVDNGPGWVAVMLGHRDELLALRPDFTAMAGLNIGAVARWPGGDADFEVRAFVPDFGVSEDPVTGSLNAGLAQWLIGAGLAPPRYTVAQGTALGRAGRVFIEQIGADIWVGGQTRNVIAGTLTL